MTDDLLACLFIFAVAFAVGWYVLPYLLHGIKP